MVTKQHDFCQGILFYTFCCVIKH